MLEKITTTFLLWNKSVLSKWTAIVNDSLYNSLEPLQYAQECLNRELCILRILKILYY